MSNKSSLQPQKHQVKPHEKNHAALQNNISAVQHVSQHQNPLNNSAPSATNNLMSPGNALNQGAMMNSKNPTPMSDTQQQHNIHQDLTGNTTPNPTDLKQHASPAGDISSMGVYTPDSTTNSVHSLHHYGQCDLDVAQLGLESPASIASDIASQNSVENVRPPSVVSHSQLNQFADCSLQQQHNQQTQQAQIHMAIHQSHANMNVPTSSPQAQQQAMIMAANQQQNQPNSNRKMSHMQVASAATVQQARNSNRSATPKARNTPTPALQQQRAQRTATPNNVVQQQMVSPGQQMQHMGMHQNPNLHQSHNQAMHQNQQLQQQQQPLQHNLQSQAQMDQYNLHGHHQVLHQDYLPQMGAAGVQNYGSQSSNTYGSIPMSIQHRSHSNLSAHNPLPSPHQRLGPSPSSCSVGNTFYPQNPNMSHSVSHTPVPTPSATPTLQQQQQQINATAGPNNNGSTNGAIVGSGSGNATGNVSSLSKLQQMTNGLDMNQTCNTSPGTTVNLTPSPSHHPHNTMTPPPASHLVNQNRNLHTPPTPAQMSALQYHKYYPGNINITPSIAISQNSSRTARNTASAPVQHMGASSPSSRVSPNVTLNSNLIAPYAPPMNGYRMASQQPGGSVASYITNSAAGFINNPSQLQMANMAMNMPQYQDQALQRAAVQQNNYYPYGILNTNPMRR